MTNQTDARREQARGNGVAHAGQFGHQAHSEPGAFDNTWWGQNEERLEAFATASIDVTVRRFGLPSNRHRKEQSYSTPGVLSVEVPVVSAEDAPRALTVTPREDRPRHEAVTYLAYDGALFASTGKDLEAALRDHYDVREPYRYGGDDDAPPSVEEGKVSAIQEEAANDWIIIDGIVHKRRSEPVLHVKSWGVELEEQYHANIDSRGFITDPEVYTIDEWAQAQAAFTARAPRHGDDLSVTLDAVDGLATFQTGYRRPPILEYDAWPRYDTWEDRHAAHAHELAKMRAGVVAIPGAVSRVDDGLGGTRAVIDWSLFSEKQERDYRHLVENADEQ